MIESTLPMAGSLLECYAVPVLDISLPRAHRYKPVRTTLVGWPWPPTACILWWLLGMVTSVYWTADSMASSWPKHTEAVHCGAAKRMAHWPWLVQRTARYCMVTVVDRATVHAAYVRKNL